MERKRFSKATWGELNPSASEGTLKVFGRVLGFQHMAMSVGRFLPGEGVKHHDHKEAEEFYYLIKGRSMIRVDDEEFEVEPHTGFRFPPETMRSVYNHTNEECWWIFVAAPAEYKYDERGG